jgi:uncharacterized membrane protein
MAMRAMYLASVWLHVIAAMTWIGGMVALVVAVLPFFRARDEALRAAFFREFGARFGKVTWICFGVLAITGTFNLWMRGVRLEDVFRPEWRQSAFGQVVLIKLGLVAVAVIVSALHERATTTLYARWLGRLTLVIGLAIVGAAIMLVRAI